MDGMTAPSERTRVRRMGKRGAYDATTVHAILDAALMCHVGYVVEGQPYVTPTAHWRDGDHVYWHGSSASRMLRTLEGGVDVCLTASLLDGLVLARSGFRERIERFAGWFEHPIDLPGRWIEAFFARQAPFDHVALTAARTKTGSVASLSLPDAYAAMDSKFWGAYRVAKSVRINAGGSLTFVSGQMAVRPTVLSVLQGAINSALEGLVRGLALEMAPVRVNAVSPGLIATPLHGGLSEADRQAMFDRAARSLPARRVGQAEDIAQAILFLATNPFVTGSTLAVDGGRAVE